MSRAAAVAVALGAGALVGMQAPINSRLGRGLGTFQAASVSFVVGLVVLLGIAAVTGPGLASVSRLPHQPWWYLTGGLLGAAYVASSLLTVRTLGVGGLTAATIAAQLTMAVVIDQFGLLGVARHPASTGRVAGLALLAVGVFLVVRE